METRAIPVELLNKIGNYLAERPFREVAGLLGELHNALQEASKPKGLQPEPTVGD